MASSTPALASAVIVPEAEDLPPPTLKRRLSATSDSQSKRRRLSNDADLDNTAAAGSPTSPSKESAPPRTDRQPAPDKAEERKRGRRLFGALLGTLSQSSSSTAQNRRAEIERKQQAKLRQQAEEHDEAKRDKREAMMAARRRQQPEYSKQSMKIRHNSLLGQARFLQTKSEPKLLYKPWELLPGDEEQIQKQVREAQTTVDKELAELETEPHVTEVMQPSARPGDAGVRQTTDDRMDTVGEQPTTREPSGPDIADPTTNNDNSATTAGGPEKVDAQEVAKDNAGDGEEIVEGEEDTVIY